MQPENFKIGGGVSESVLHPAVLVALILAVLLMFVLGRKYLVVPVLGMAFLVPMGQQIVLGGIHFLVLRFVVVAGLVRALLMRRPPEEPLFPGRFTAVDKIFGLSTIYTVGAFLALFSFQMGALVNRLGFVWDVLGGFLLMRLVIRDEESIKVTVRTLAVVSLILAIGMLNEHFRMQNVFGILGGVPAVPEVRDGAVRAQGSFAHPLLAGTFGATVLPLFLWLWHCGKSKSLALVGLCSCTVVTAMAASSTPFLAYLSGLGAVCFWPFRKKMRLVRWGIVGLLAGLNMVMKAPVWFLIGHASLLGSSSSDHRAYLVDTFLRHFSDWWLMGTNNNANWGWDMWDTSNQYVSEGITGGLVALACFIAVLSICFRWVGKARKAVEGETEKEWYFWLLGAALFSNTVAFFGISYFDNIRLSWFLLIAIVTAASVPLLQSSAQPETTVVRTSRESARESGFSPAAPELRARTALKAKDINTAAKTPGARLKFRYNK
jgi:hypothetical protein